MFTIKNIELCIILVNVKVAGVPPVFTHQCGPCLPRSTPTQFLAPWPKFKTQQIEIRKLLVVAFRQSHGLFRFFLHFPVNRIQQLSVRNPFCCSQNIRDVSKSYSVAAVRTFPPECWNGYNDNDSCNILRQCAMGWMYSVFGSRHCSWTHSVVHKFSLIRANHPPTLCVQYVPSRAHRKRFHRCICQPKTHFYACCSRTHNVVHK